MSKVVKLFAIAALIAGVFAMTPDPAAAQRHHGGSIGVFHGGGAWHGGAWRGGGWHRGWHGGGWRGGWAGFGWGWPGPFFGWGPYYDPYYYAGPDCGWAYVRVLRYRHWVLRRVWRCW